MFRLRHVVTVCQMVSKIHCHLNANGNYTFDEYDSETTRELELAWASIQSLDPSIGRLYNLGKLRLDDNDLTSLPDEIGELQSLKTLALDGNKLGSLPESIGNLSKLSELLLHENNLTGLPKAMVRLTGLTYLGLDSNPLGTLPEQILAMAKLGTLELRNTGLLSLPDGIENLTKLKELHLNNNGLTGLPQTMGNLKNLKILGLAGNPLGTFPAPILAMTRLRMLYLSITRLHSIPDEIGNLTRLKLLFLSGNGLAGLPQSMGNLKNLETLDLSDNPLSTFPTELLKMTSLKTLYLEHTGLLSVPDDIRNLKKLRDLHLHSNQLASLPEGIFQLANSIVLLDLRNNNLPLPLQIRLRGAFADHVMLDMEKVDREVTEILKEDVYLDLESKPLRWNYEKLRLLRQKPVPESTLDERGLKKLWKENIAFYISKKNQMIVKKFIHHLFNPDKEYKRWKMNVIHIPLAKNLLEAVMDELSKVKDDDEKIISNINAICEGLEHCPDRQIGEMMFVYYLLIGEVDPTSSLEEFAKYFVAQEKTRVFEIAMTPTVAPQNVHVLNFWKYELRDEVGFDFEFTTEFGTMGQDRFNGWYGNALKAFYDFFTPEYAIDGLTMKINSSNSLLNKALEMINGDDIAEDRKALMYLVSEDRVAHHRALELLKLSDDEGFRSETRERKYEQGMGSELFDQVLARLRAEDSSDEVLLTKFLKLREILKKDIADESTLSARELFERTLEQCSRDRFIVPEGEEAIDFAGSITPEFTRYFLIKMDIIRETN